MPVLELGELARIQLRDLRVVTADRRGSALAAGGFVGLAVVVGNGATSTLSNGGPTGFHLSVQWAENAGSLSPPDAARCSLPVPVPAGSVRLIHLCTRAPEVPGRHFLRVTGVQEGVSWLDLLGPGGVAELVVDVA